MLSTAVRMLSEKLRVSKRKNAFSLGVVADSPTRALRWGLMRWRWDGAVGGL